MKVKGIYHKEFQYYEYIKIDMNFDIKNSFLIHVGDRSSNEQLDIESRVTSIVTSY